MVRLSGEGEEEEMERVALVRTMVQSPPPKSPMGRREKTG